MCDLNFDVLSAEDINNISYIIAYLLLVISSLKILLYLYFV